jgi:hypothetical protein
MATKYTKGSKNTIKFTNLLHDTKIYPNLDFGFETIPSGNTGGGGVNLTVSFYPHVYCQEGNGIHCSRNNWSVDPVKFETRSRFLRINFGGNLWTKNVARSQSYIQLLNLLLQR